MLIASTGHSTGCYNQYTCEGCIAAGCGWCEIESTYYNDYCFDKTDSYESLCKDGYYDEWSYVPPGDWYTVSCPDADSERADCVPVEGQTDCDVEYLDRCETNECPDCANCLDNCEAICAANTDGKINVNWCREDGKGDNCRCTDYYDCPSSQEPAQDTATKPDVPTNPYPEDGGTIYDTTPTLRWEDTIDSGGYYILYLYQGGSYTVIFLKDDLSSNSYTLISDEALERGKSYDWDVRACNMPGYVCSDWSEKWSFTVEEEPTGPDDDICSVESGRECETIYEESDCNCLEECEVICSEKGKNVRWCSGIGDNYEGLEDPPEDSCYCTDDSECSPLPVKLIYPGHDDEIDNTKPFFKWEDKYNENVYYTVYYKTVAVGSKYSSTDKTENKQIIIELEQLEDKDENKVDTKYHWYVETCFDEEKCKKTPNIDFTNPYSFTLLKNARDKSDESTPPEPELTSPEKGATVSLPLRMEWTDVEEEYSLGYTVTYDIYIGVKRANLQTMFEKCKFDITKNYYEFDADEELECDNIEKLEAGVSYEWYVCAINAEENKRDCSPASWFKIKSESKEEKEEPVIEEGKVKFKLLAGQNVVSLPLTQAEIEEQCDDAVTYFTKGSTKFRDGDNYIVYYDPEASRSKRYKYTNKMSPGLGYLLAMKSDCTVTFDKVDAGDVTITLKGPGEGRQNIISIPGTPGVTKVTQDQINEFCKEKGEVTYFTGYKGDNGYIVYYDTEAPREERFKTTDTIEPYRGYYVAYKGEECQFTIEETDDGVELVEP